MYKLQSSRIYTLLVTSIKVFLSTSSTVRSRKDYSYREYRRHNAMVYVLSIGHGVHNISIQYHTIQYNTGAAVDGK